MGMLYRQDIFDKYGIAPAEDLGRVRHGRAASCTPPTPNVYITNLASNQNGAWMGLLWQAGAKPFATTGTGVGRP